MGTHPEETGSFLLSAVLPLPLLPLIELYLPSKDLFPDSLPSNP